MGGSNIFFVGPKFFEKAASLNTGQIIATENTTSPPNGGDCKGIPLISGKSRLVKYYNLPRLNTNILGGSNLMQMDGNFEGFPSYIPWKFNSSPLKSYLPTQ